MNKIYGLMLVPALLLSACDEPTPAADATEMQFPSVVTPAPVAAAPAPVTAKPKPKPVVRKICADCGVISSIRAVKIEGEGTGMGAVSGAAAGGVVGNQFGKGDGKTVMTAVGVLAGAVGGHYAEKKIREETIYRLTVAMEDGSTRTVDRKELNGIGAGMKVKVAGDSVSLRD
ncbi:MAG: glycine zipper 2TM domain-containing protein [Pseudomonadota bacterium]